MRTLALYLIFLFAIPLGCGPSDFASPRDVVATKNRESGSIANPPDVAPPSQQSPTRQSTEADRPSKLEGRRYDGLSIDAWRERMKNLDPRDPQAARAVPGLIALVSDRDLPWFTRRQAALCLAGLGDAARDGIPVLVGLLTTRESADANTPLWAAKALALYGPEAQSATPALILLVEDKTADVTHRLAATEALAQIGVAHPRVVPTLIRLLRAADEGSPASESNQNEIALRIAATDAIGLIGPPAAPAIPILIRATRSNSEDLRRKSVAALGRMGPTADIAVPALVDALVEDESTAVREAAAAALATIGPPSVEALARLLSSQTAETRWRAAQSLGQIGRPARAAVPQLQPLVEDDDPLVRVHAAEAVWNITGDASKVIPVLVAELTNRRRPIRALVIDIFARMGSNAAGAVEPLQQLQHDKREYVRAAATKALEKIDADTPPASD